jgi:SAM-dependent methyltransferase
VSTDSHAGAAPPPDRTSAGGDPRSDERLRAHYEVERELADRLRSSPASARRALYASVYNELFERVPDHPQLRRKSSAEMSEAAVSAQYRLLRRFLNGSTTFLEVGAGDCAVSLRACRDAGRVIAADVSDAITGGIAAPDNFRLVLFDGCDLALERESVDVAYSNQVVEHLHPDDAVTQLTSIWRALKPGGVYVCVTPNRVNGPHDVSRFFDPVATGFHLKEYTYADLDRLMRQVGFVGTRACVGLKGHFILVPVSLMRALERAAFLLPRGARARMGRHSLLERLLIVRMLGRKPARSRGRDA